MALSAEKPSVASNFAFANHNNQLSDKQTDARDQPNMPSFAHYQAKCMTCATIADASS
jgi:hypothetical protein